MAQKDGAQQTREASQRLELEKLETIGHKSMHDVLQSSFHAMKYRLNWLYNIFYV